MKDLLLSLKFIHVTLVWRMILVKQNRPGAGVEMKAPPG